jgi:hypothetical protein
MKAPPSLRETAPGQPLFAGADGAATTAAGHVAGRMPGRIADRVAVPTSNPVAVVTRGTAAAQAVDRPAKLSAGTAGISLNGASAAVAAAPWGTNVGGTAQPRASSMNA